MAATGQVVASHHVEHAHCLAVLVRDMGFTSHAHATRVLRGEPDPDFGTFLHTFGPFTIEWFTDHALARRAVKPELRFLLGYLRQYVVVPRMYIEALGLDPDDVDWRAVDWDLAHPADRAARVRLYTKRLLAWPEDGDEALCRPRG